jgi:molecular chaperone DnaJ
VTRASVSFAEASMGGSIQLDLPDETQVTVEVPAGTQPGEVISVKGKGLPRIDGRGEGRGRGALQVLVQVEVPRGLSSRAKELLRELDDELARGREKAKTA